MWRFTILMVAAVLALTGRVHGQAIKFSDETEAAGLKPLLDNWRYGHGASWGDIDGSGRPALYIGAFADRDTFAGPGAPLPNMLLLNTPEGFVLSEQKELQFIGKKACTTMTLFVDLNNNGRLDLILGNYADRPSRYRSAIFENLGDGKFRERTPQLDVWPDEHATRNITPLDMNNNGLLDLIVLDGRGNTGVMVLENLGDFRFEVATEKYGLPTSGLRALGLAVGDLNDDGVFDLVIPQSGVVYVSGPDGKYRAIRPDFFPKMKGEDWPCGAAMGDLTGNGRMDVVLTVHGTPGYFFVARNAATIDGMPQLEDITRESGAVGQLRGPSLMKIPLKTTHVELQDFNNNGLVDIYLTATYIGFDGSIQPAILRNMGVEDGMPRFRPPPAQGWLGYYAAGPAADYDRDGRMDVFLASWFDEIPNHLMRNVSAAGNWLHVAVKGDGKTYNTMGIGAIVRVYRAGDAGNPEALLGRRDIAIGGGYCSAGEALAHFGLAGTEEVDVEVSWRGKTVTRARVAANRIVEIPFP